MHITSYACCTTNYAHAIPGGPPSFQTRTDKLHHKQPNNYICLPPALGRIGHCHVRQIVFKGKATVQTQGQISLILLVFHRKKVWNAMWFHTFSTKTMSLRRGWEGGHSLTLQISVLGSVVRYISTLHTALHLFLLWPREVWKTNIQHCFSSIFAVQGELIWCDNDLYLRRKYAVRPFELPS